MLYTKLAILKRSSFNPWTCRACFRPFHKTNLRKNLPASWLSKASNVIYNTGEAFLRKSYKRLGSAVQALDDILGISEVQKAQSSVKKAEDDFMRTRGQVQAGKSALDSVQESLREIRQKLDRVPRDDEKYLALATEEHKILIQEKKMRSDYETLETLERDRFTLLSAAVRDSHEKERARAERTKHWSVIGSVGGAALGIFGSTVVNYVRLKQVKDSIKETGNTLIEKIYELKDLVKAQGDQMGTKATKLQESFSTQSKLLDERLDELESVLNFVTLNLASEPLKEFGIHLQPPAHSKNLASEQSPAVGHNKKDRKDVIDTIASRIDSVIKTTESLQQTMHGDLKTLLYNLDKLDSSVHQNKDATLEELRKLSKSLKNQSLPSNGGKEILTKSYKENNQWWMKASVLCTVLTATFLIYEFFK